MNNFEKRPARKGGAFLFLSWLGRVKVDLHWWVIAQWLRGSVLGTRQVETGLHH